MRLLVPVDLHPQLLEANLTTFCFNGRDEPLNQGLLGNLLLSELAPPAVSVAIRVGPNHDVAGAGGLV